jgi:hypothetical protein
MDSAVLAWRRSTYAGSGSGIRSVIPDAAVMCSSRDATGAAGMTTAAGPRGASGARASTV